MIRLAVLVQYTPVTDGQTDRQTDGIGVAYTRYSIYAVARNKMVLYYSAVRILQQQQDCFFRRFLEFVLQQRLKPVFWLCCLRRTGTC